jgi:6-phosphogluconolactonase (cycloisomerase 2 family)
VFSTSFYGFAGPANQTIQSLVISRRGRLSEAAGSPTGFPESMTGNIPPLPPFLPPGIEKLAFGIATHPTRPFVYILGTANNRVAIYRYNSRGALTFTGQEENTGSFAACWVVLTSDGRFMYTANTVTQDISMFRVSRGGGDLTFVEKVPMPSIGTTFNLAIDPDDRTLYAIGGHDDPDGPRPQQVNPDGSVNPQRMPADGNFIEAFRIQRNGRLRSLSTTALPVRLSQLPYGLAVLEQVERRRRGR